MRAATLAIDTATAACSVALIEGQRIVRRMSEPVGRGHAERLVPMVAELLGGDTPRSVLVDCGPGSFTGVRVGLAAAIGMGIGWGVPVRGFSSLDVVAAAVFGRAPDLDALAVALPGGHGELFVGRFARGPRSLAPLASLSPAAAALAVPEAVVAGSGAAALIAARGHGRAVDALPDAADVALLPPACLFPPRPIYGRAPDARPRAAA